MLILNSLKDLAKLDVPLHLALGVFDGVHVGHQAVIARVVNAAAREGGLAGMLTFEPHPIRVIAPNKAPKALLETLSHKARTVLDLGVQLFISIHFDEKFAQMEAADFIQQLMAAPVKTIAVGEDWRFGHNRSGDVKFLATEALCHNFKLEAVAPVMHDGERISSTRIRQAIRDGNLDAAAQMLGRTYAVSGIVIEGKKLGKTIGFPTANLETIDAQLPPDGVWAVQVRLPSGVYQNGVANLGFRPTVDGQTKLLEVHLFDYSADLYGQELEVRFQKYLRAEIKFESVEALRIQIQYDTSVAKNFFLISKSEN